ncbi:unnamed protein product [Mucor fragilis]
MIKDCIYNRRVLCQNIDCKPELPPTSPFWSPMPDPTTQPEHAIRFIGESSNRKPRYQPPYQPAFVCQRQTASKELGPPNLPASVIFFWKKQLQKNSRPRCLLARETG